MIHPKGTPAVPPSREDEASGTQAAQAAGPRSFESVDLFEGANEVLIQHRGREYRLRITQNGKLILNA